MIRIILAPTATGKSHFTNQPMDQETLVLNRAYLQKLASDWAIPAFSHLTDAVNYAVRR
jgi:hypothetical protein